MKRFGKRRTVKTHESATAKIESSSQFRLCHFCLYLNESQNEVTKCDRCGKYLASEAILRATNIDFRVDFDESEESSEGESHGNRRQNPAAPPPGLRYLVGS